MAEETNDFVASLRTLIQSELLDFNTSVEGTVRAYANGLATVLPDATKRFADGDTLPFPQLFQVPIRWPSFNGGSCGIKGPIRVGDKVLVVFAQQARDGTDDERRFDMTDAYAIPCGNAQAGQASNNADMIMWFGDAYIKLTESGALEINAPGGSKIITPNNEFTGNNKVDGNQQTIGTTTNTGATAMNGGFSSIGSATNDGKNIGDDHRHSGVQTGTGQSGPVV
jgi:hypothetical protein